jgi:hypothetical protein
MKMETKWKPKVAKSCKKVAIIIIAIIIVICAKIVIKNTLIKAVYGNTK